MPTTTIDGQRPRKASSDCPSPRNVSSSTTGATSAYSTTFAANAPAWAGSQCVGVSPCSLPGLSGSGMTETIASIR